MPSVLQNVSSGSAPESGLSSHQMNLPLHETASVRAGRLCCSTSQSAGGALRPGTVPSPVYRPLMIFTRLKVLPAKRRLSLSACTRHSGPSGIKHGGVRRRPRLLKAVMRDRTKAEAATPKRSGTMAKKQVNTDGCGQCVAALVGDNRRRGERCPCFRGSADRSAEFRQGAIIRRFAARARTDIAGGGGGGQAAGAHRRTVG